jgi:myo-inositol-1(or 4)-monophosphatase
VAAGCFLVKEAGGKVSDFKGGDDYVFGKEILACNTGIHEEFLGVIKNEFSK